MATPFFFASYIMTCDSCKHVRVKGVCLVSECVSVCMYAFVFDLNGVNTECMVHFQDA